MKPNEEKIINAIKYFVKNTKYVGRTKLFKLLFFLDFIHFSKHGQTVTGLNYFTFPFGPVPKTLFDQISEGKIPKNFLNNFNFIEESEFDDVDKFKTFKISLKDKKIDLDLFTPYEKENIELVTEIFKEATVKDMTESTHLPQTPWSKTKDEKGLFKEIDYFLAITENTPFDLEEIKERFELQQEMSHNGYN